jgi:hypothetical protein
VRSAADAAPVPPAAGGGRHVAAGRREGLLRLTPPALLVALFALVQGTMLRPPWPSDSMTYFRAAASYPDVTVAHRELRIGITMPVRLAQEVLGYSEAAYYVVPLLSTLLLVLAVYRLGARTVGRPAGWVAAALLLVTPLLLTVSSQIAPDVLATGLVVLGVSLLLDPAPPGRTPVGRLVVVGLLLGWAYLAREYAALLFPIVPVVLLLRRLPLRRLVPVALPMALLFAVEVALNAVLFDQPLARLAVTLGHGSTGPAEEAMASYAAGSTRLDALLRLPSALVDDVQLGGPLIAILLAALVVGALAARDRDLVLLLVWFGLLAVPFTLLGGLIDPANPLLPTGILRYWLLALPAIYLGGAGVAALLLRRLPLRVRRSPVIGAGTAVVLVVGVIGAITVLPRDGFGTYRLGGATQHHELREWLAGPGADVEVLWTDRRTASLMPLIAADWRGRVRWDGEVRAFDGPDGAFVGAGEIDDGAIVLNAVGLTFLQRPGGPLRGADATLPEHLGNPGEGWVTAVRRVDDGLVIHVAGERPPPVRLGR